MNENARLANDAACGVDGGILKRAFRALCCTMLFCIVLRAFSMSSFAAEHDVVDQRVYQRFSDNRYQSVHVIVNLKTETMPSFSRMKKRRRWISDVQSKVFSSSGTKNAGIIYQYRNIPAFTGYVNAKTLAALAADPNVKSIGLDGQIQANLNVSVPFIGADTVHQVSGYTGKGVTVAVLDTGIDSDHPDLADNIAIGGYHFLDQGADVGEGAEDDNGHGTHVAGIITSSGAAAPIGVAPDADILPIKVLDANGQGWVSDLAMGIDYMVSRRTDDANLSIANMSLASGVLYQQCPCDGVDAETEILSQSIEAAKTAGILLIAASGNSGATNKMGSPACLSGVVATAAVYDALPDEIDEITDFSNRSACNAFTAPGEAILSSRKGGGSKVLSGTSMAAPHVSGTAALMAEKAAEFSIDTDPDAFIGLMKNTGLPTYDPFGTVPNPIRVDAFEAVNSFVKAIKPLADTYAAAATPDINLGTESSLAIGPETESVAYLKFDLSSIPSNAAVSKAKLRLRCESTTDSGAAHITIVHENDCWNETGVVWSNRPGAHVTGISSTPPGPDMIWEIEVTDLVGMWIENGVNNRGFLIYKEDGGSITSDSSEGNFSPELLISWTLDDGRLAWPVDCSPDCNACRVGYFPDIDGDGQSFDCSVNNSPAQTRYGTDIIAPYGTVVRAAADGEVLWVFDGNHDRCDQDPLNSDCVDPGYQVCTPAADYCREDHDDCSCEWCFNGGNVVVVKHDGHGVPGVFATRYDNLRKDSILVAPGEMVAKGQPIAEVGAAGRSEIPHMYFEVWGATYDDPVDPWAGDCGGENSLWEAQRAYGNGCRIVDFPDPNLESIIRQLSGRAAGEIYDTDLTGITALDASSAEISSLGGIESCINLEYLNAGNNLISDIGVLAGLLNLEAVNLSENQIMDIGALVSNSGVGMNDDIELSDNPLSCRSYLNHIPSLVLRQVQVSWDDDGIIDHDADGMLDEDEDRNANGVVDADEPDPCISDTDGDRINDGDEFTYWGDGWNLDADADGVINLLDPDSDNDGFCDGDEIEDGFDPSDPADHPIIAAPAVSSIGMFVIFVLLSCLGLFCIQIYSPYRQVKR